MIEIIFIIILTFHLIYYFYSNRYFYQIYLLKKRNTIKPIESKPYLLNEPLYKFYINSSHNSYIDSIQHASIVKKNTIKNILNLGARCIEIDLININNKPVVAHGIYNYYTTSYLQLDTILNEINDNAFNTSDPLIIFCEIINPIGKEYITNIKNSFIKIFGERIKKIDKNFIADEPIKLFLNKVILLGSKDKYNILSDIFYPSNNFINFEDTDKQLLNINTTNQLSRIYKTEGIGSFLSNNYNFKPIWKNNYKLTTMNFQMYDKYLYDYLSYFKNYSFIHESELEI